MLDDFKEEQPIAYKIFKNAINKNKLSHAYLIEANGYSKKNELAYAAAKYILCDKHHTNIKEGHACPFCSKSKENQLDIKIIKPEGLIIKKKQMEDLQKEFSTKSIDSNKKIYIIEEADKLNTSSSNAILKFLEEPEEGIIAFLVVDNMYQLLNTIISRCQIVNLQNNEIKNYENTYEKINFLLHEEIDSDLIENTLSFIDYLEKNGISTISHIQRLIGNYLSKENLLQVLDIMTWFYKDCLNLKMNLKIEIYNSFYDKIEEIKNKNEIEILCKKIGTLLDIKENILYNANTSLQLDMLVKKFSEVKI